MKLGLLTGTALLLGIAAIVLLYDVLDPAYGAVYISTLVAADLCVLVLFGAYLVQQLVVRPLQDAVAAAEAIAGGDLQRRVPEGATQELQHLAASVNRMTDRLLEERANLVRAEKLASVGRLAAGVAHEIGNPLGAINGYLHVLRSRLAPLAPTAEITDAIACLDRESTRIDRIVRGLLDYSRARPSTPTPVDINRVARSVLDLLIMQGALKAIELDLQLAHDGPFVYGERHDLEQLFVNLLLNAVDAVNRRGKIAVHVQRASRITLRQPGVRRGLGPDEQAIEHPPSTRAQLWLSSHDSIEVAKIVIADSGPGVPAELADRIFDPFFTTKAPGNGTGLGLAIVARIVDNLHGTVWVTTAREGGAAFHILFPLAPKPIGGDARYTPPLSHSPALAK